MFLIYELFLGLSRGKETFDFGECFGNLLEMRVRGERRVWYID